MKASGALLLRGMRWRLGMSVLTVITSAIAVGAAVLGPLYLRTASDSVVRTSVGSATVDAQGATLLPPPSQAASLGQIQRAEQILQDRSGKYRFYGGPITSVISGVGLIGPGSSPLRSQLFSRTGICGVLRFQAGRCDLAAGDVALSERSARELGIRLGAVLHASVQGTNTPVRLRVTGIYSVPNLSLPYWWGDGPGYFPFGQTTGPRRLPEIDPLIASPATALAVPAQDVPEVMGQVPLRAAGIGLGDETALERALSRDRAAVAAQGIVLSSQLPALLAAAGQQRHVMSTIVVIAAVQLVLLAIWVLGGLLVRSSDARRAEIRVARLRGFPGSSLVAVTAAEPALLCLLGVVLGTAGAWGTVTVARNRLLEPEAVVAPDLWVFAALGLTLLAVALTLGGATFRLLRSSGLSDSPTAASRPARRTSLVADAVLLVLSIVALVALSTSGALAGRGDPIASAAPALIALGVAVVAVQVVLFACRIGVSASANSERVAAFLALRQIVRRPDVLRQARVLIIALCLACFAVSAWWVARTNRAAAARFTVGTRAVVTVTPQGVGLERAVDRADPRGRFAMAAVTVTTQSSDLLAVDARRLAVASSWPAGISRSSVAATSRALDPPTAPAVSLPDTPVAVAATTTATRPAAADLANLDLALWVFNPQAGTSIVELGPLHPGARLYQGSLAYACPGGCRLAGVGTVPAPARQAPPAGTVDVTVGRVSSRAPSGAVTPVAADLSPRSWRITAAGVRIETAPAGGLTLAIPAAAAAAYTGAVGSSIAPMASPADHPSVLPGVVTSEVESINGASAPGSTIPSQGLDGNTLDVSPAVTTSALPRIGGDGVIVDLDLLARSQVNPTAPYAADQVWLGPAAPPNALARLRAAGLRVDGVERAAAVFAQLQRSGPALADDFLLVATLAAVLAAAISTLGALGATTRQRATELTALEVGGIRRRVLARSLAIESAVLAVTGLSGAVAGVVAAIMAIPALPELTTPSLVPLQYGLPGGLVAAVSAAVMAVVLLAGAAVAAVLIHRMSPFLLRTAPDDTVG